MALKIYACILSMLCGYLSGKRLLDKENRGGYRVFWFCAALMFFAQLIVMLFYLLSA
jgi:uncharacterized RDD family membrane protein YckC